MLLGLESMSAHFMYVERTFRDMNDTKVNQVMDHLVAANAVFPKCADLGVVTICMCTADTLRTPTTDPPIEKTMATIMTMARSYFGLQKKDLPSALNARMESALTTKKAKDSATMPPPSSPRSSTGSNSGAATKRQKPGTPLAVPVGAESSAGETGQSPSKKASTAPATV